MKLGNVLITGCAGDIAISILRILREVAPLSRIFGSDIHDDHPGQLLYDKCLVLPKASDSDYFRKIAEVVETYAVNVIIPTSESEIYEFDALRCSGSEFAFLFSQQYILMANSKSIEIGKDKLKTARYLQSQGLPFPWSVPVSEGSPREIPCILKKACSQGSKHIYQINHLSDVAFFGEKHQDWIWQELLGPNNQEYTCGLFSSKSGEVRQIVLRRKLVGGLTGSAQVIVDTSISDLLVELAKSLQLSGSINVQLRLTERGPVIFEVNPRFSSTVRFRHLLGFCDVVWSLQDKFGYTIDPYTPPEENTRMYKVAEELLLTN
ncbi:ATP-grasp domain-containing protein [Leptolyngbya iicbica]|nr:ATP-grasp domain-containing protein [Leptolyngbya sp. LK]